MGFAKANELLLLGKKIDAKTAVDWNLCSQVVPNTVDASDNPFDPNSLASHLCGKIEKQLLSLPLSQKTAKYFVALIRGGGCSRKQRMQQVCRQELLKLDERGRTGQILEALQALKIGRSKL